MTDLIPHHDQTPDRRVGFLPSKDETGRIWGIAQTVAGTSFVPKALRGDVPAIMAAMLTGRELGILPMRALRQVSIIEGKPTPSPELMMAMALKAGHDVYVAETTRERCVVEVRRSDWPEDRVARLSWELEDAVDAGLCSIDPDTGKARARSQSGSRLPWEAYTRAMLRSRAVSEACRTWLPDVVEGASYAPEEIGAAVDAHGHDRGLVDAAEERGETFDPLEGESDEVRAAVAEAMGEEPQVDPDTGEEITDAEILEDECARCGQPLAGEHDCPGSPEADLFPDPEADAATASTDLVAEAATAARTGGGEPLEDDGPLSRYGELNVGEVSALIRSGDHNLDQIAALEEARDGGFRRTVRGALESAGWRKATNVPGPATVDPQETPNDDAGTTPPTDPAGPESGSQRAEDPPLPDGDDLDARRELLRRWKAAYRELSQVDEDTAKRHLSSRMSLRLGDDQTWATFEHLDTMRDIVGRIERARSQAIPF